MASRLEQIIAIDKILGDIADSAKALKVIADEHPDSKLQTLLYATIVDLAVRIYNVNKFLMENLVQYTNKDLDDAEFRRITKSLEDSDGNK